MLCELVGPVFVYLIFIPNEPVWKNLSECRYYKMVRFISLPFYKILNLRPDIFSDKKYYVLHDCLYYFLFYKVITLSNTLLWEI